MTPHQQSGILRNGRDSGASASALPATILLVEDEPAVRLVTCEALEIAGYRVLAAEGPASAVHIAGNPSISIDLLLSDVVMPGMNGPELARHIRQSRPELLTLFMTGYAESDALRLALAGSSHQHIQKPFTIAGLLSRVAEALSSRWKASEISNFPQYSSP